jgi:RNase H
MPVGFQEWLPKWMRQGFRTSTGAPVKNVQLIQYLAALLQARENVGQKVRLQYVRGHAGEVGNEGADLLAVRGTALPPVAERDWNALRRNTKVLIDPVSICALLSSHPPLRVDVYVRSPRTPQIRAVLTRPRRRLLQRFIHLSATSFLLRSTALI